MTVRVFVSYRHGDSPHAAGRLRDRLAEAFGEANVFFDVESIEFGQDFRVVIRDMVASVDAVLVVIGSGFAPERLASSLDFIRTEVTEALAQRKLVIPVLVGDVPMLGPDQLPDELEAFAYLHAARLRTDPDFRPDATRLVDSLRRAVTAQAPPASDPEPAVATPPTPPGPGTLDAVTAAEPAARRLASAHGIAVYSLAFSPDGQLLASAGAEDRVRLWDVATGYLRGTLTGHSAAQVNSMAFSPDGSLLAAAGDYGAVLLWHPSEDEVVVVLDHGGPVSSVVFSPDGGLVATAGTMHTAKLWDPASGELVRPFFRHADKVVSLAFSPGGNLLATAAEDDAVRLWDPATGDLVHRLVGHTELVSSVAFSPSGSLLASAGGDRVVRLWAAPTFEQARVLAGHTDWVNSVAFSPDGSVLASAGGDAAVRLWDPLTGRNVRALADHTESVNAVAFSPDGRWLASAGADVAIRLWALSP